MLKHTIITFVLLKKKKISCVCKQSDLQSSESS